MGTRNVTIIKMNGKVVASKYCQWDGYPTGLGKDLHAFIVDEMNLRTLKSRLKKCYEITEEKADEMFDDYEKKAQAVEKAMLDAGLNRWDNLFYKTKAKIQRKLIPTLTRDTNGADFLLAIQESEKGLPFAYTSENKGNLEYATGKDQFSFGCEYCYEVDLDKKTLAIYDGFYKGKPHSTFTFAKLKKENVNTFMEEVDAIMNPPYNEDQEYA